VLPQLILSHAVQVNAAAAAAHAGAAAPAARLQREGEARKQRCRGLDWELGRKAGCVR
jgi:hypothetical protein